MTNLWLRRALIALAAGMLVGLGACAPTSRPMVHGANAAPDAPSAQSMTVAAPNHRLDGGSALKDPKTMTGMKADQVSAALGEPALRRRDVPAEIWQYKGQGCILDVFLYDERETKRVAHVAVRSRDHVAPARCLSGLTQRKIVSRD